MTVEIPEKLKANPVFAGYPVPFTVHVDDNDIPDFRARDDDKWVQCARDRLCGLCGKKLGWWIVFVGGPKSVESRLFSDLPMHEECARYALAVRAESAAGKQPVPPMLSPRAKRVALYLTRGLTLARRGKGVCFRADAPKSVEWEDEKK